MSLPSQTLVSSSQLESILDASLDEYKKKTENDLSSHWLSVEFQSCDSVDAVLDIIQNQATVFDKFRDGDKKIMKWIGSLVPTLYKFSTLGESVGKAPPSVKAVFIAVGVLLAAAKDVRSSHDALVELFERMESLFKHLGKFSLPIEMAEIFTMKIVAEVLSLLSIATRKVKRRRLKISLKRLLGRRDIEDTLKRLESLVQQATKKGIAVTANDTDELSKWNNIVQVFRQWLVLPDPSTNYSIGCRILHEGTSAWFFESSIFKEWVSNGSLLWIHGKPGSGKSILCSAIIKHVTSLRDAGHAFLAYFFFDFRDLEKQSIHDFVTSLLIQLSTHSNACCKIISRVYSAHQNGAQQPSDDALRKCLREVLFALAQQPIYIIVDALDECPNMFSIPSPQMRALGLLRDLVNMRLANFHICVTSRPEISIGAVLEPLASGAISLHGEIGQQKDIYEYVNHVIYSNEVTKKWRDEDKELVVEQLTENVDGMFRWVFCKLEALTHCPSEGIGHALDKFPEALNETYERLLMGIKESRRKDAYRLLQCLVVAVRPLRVEELAEILAMDFDMAHRGVPTFRPDWRWDDPVGAVLSTCSSLIEIVDDNGSQIDKFSHSSVKRFLLSNHLANSISEASRFHIVLETAHLVLAQACLTFLLHLDVRTRVRGLPLAEYAAEHWVTHVQFKGVTPRVMDEMASLFSPDKPHVSSWFTAWIGIYLIDEPHKTYLQFYSKMPAPLSHSSLSRSSALFERPATEHPQYVADWYEFALLAALRRKDFPVAEILLKCGVSVNIRGIRGRTLLHDTVGNSDAEVVRFLLKHGADANSRQDDLSTPLHLAVRSSQEQGVYIAKLLLERGADAHARDRDYATPWMLARYLGKTDVARVLLYYDAKAPTVND